MNLRSFSLAILVSALPYVSSAQAAGVKFNAGDFVAYEKTGATGESVLDVRLSKSGKAKVRKFSQSETQR